jgi:RimJ/RimL family protein N-acetyltransferase
MRNAVMIGERVYLRPLELGDAEELARHAAVETETFFDDGRVPFSPLSFEHWIADLYKQQPPSEIEFAVCVREDDRFLGMVGVEGIDWVNRTGETGSYLGLPENRGKGYGTEAKHLLLEYCFDRIQLEMLHSMVWEPNTRSAAALRKQGYQPAGRMSHPVSREGVYHDFLMFDLSREEWLAARDAWRASRAESAVPQAAGEDR